MRGLVFFDRLGQEVDSLVFLKQLSDFRKEGLEIYGVTTLSKDEVSSIKGFNKLYVLPNNTVNKAVSEYIIKLFKDLNIDILLGPNVKNTTEVLSYASSKLAIPMITELTSIEFSEGQRIIVKRPIIGGRALISYEFKTPIAATLPLRKFTGEIPSIEPSIEEVELKYEDIKLIERSAKAREAVDIEAAEIVVGVGRGFKNKDDIKLAYELAELLRGEVGCSRPIAGDLHWLSEDRWIGVSGKKLRGKLYIACGISGAPQHIMAASDVKVIVAVNKDENAPIFRYADYGVVADLYQFLPAFISRLKERISK